MIKDYQDITQYILGISYSANNKYKRRLNKNRAVKDKPNNNVYPICSICGDYPEHGLYDGFRINGNFICSKCETKLIDSREEEEYDTALKAIKTVLFG